MRVLYIHNNYASDNTGEEHAAESLVNQLQENGHIVEWYRRSSAELEGSPLKQAKSFFTGVWNPVAINAARKKIREFKPDIVQVQNLYPLISPRVLKNIKAACLPVVMRCPNYRLFCPTGLFFDSNNEICEKCTSKGHELWCIRKNCTGSRGKSVGYALRNFIARITGVFNKYVDVFIVQSEFQKNKFTELGMPESKIEILPGITPEVKCNKSGSAGTYITFVGRVSPEKGIDDFLAAARLLPDLKFAVAGNVPGGTNYEGSPTNVEWKGFLKGDQLDELYQKSAVIIVPSRWYEGFPNVITRAMYYSKPVITTDIGCFPDIIDHEVNGFMFPPGDINSLVSHIQWIMQNPAEAVIMGQNGREKAEREYSRDVIYQKLMGIYSKALGVTKVS